MNRRRFLSSTMLSGLGLAAAPAHALTIKACEADSGEVACRELAKHQEQLTRLDALLAEKGLDEAARKAALAAARCPFCGSMLAG